MNTCNSIIGISETGHDPSMTFIEDNKIILALEEERTTRVKHQMNAPLSNRCKLDVQRFLGDVNNEPKKVSCWLRGFYPLGPSHYRIKILRYFLTSQGYNLHYN